ncbi:SPOR domain-containing protein [Dyadobacter subterraneus]|uniref:SPOR domain-containing protein n=1 Tax=Dyadobacter subterraneus TaxID=2773304 RepID=A0ABR9WBN5_9BACT|nr:SPOR domain-containing protein [Dyadobacter subterraneus]MBE9462875.1 SPOR domain-containing protein [Dyadobacter subterraneus]
MIAVETVIRKLVTDYEFVIIPGFGALLSHQAQAFYNAETGMFSPPDKRLAFNEFLKLDDGLLANYISRQEQISHGEAVAYVKRYTDKLRVSLQTSERATIEGIGEFSMNVEGKLVFEPNTDRYFKDEWYGFRSTAAKLVEKRASVFNTPVVHVHEDHVEVLEEEEPRAVKVNWIAWTAAAMIAGLMFYFSLFYVSSNGENRSTLNPFTSFFEKMTSSTPVVAKKAPAAPKRRIVYVVKKAPAKKIDSIAPVAATVEIAKPVETKPEVIIPKETASVSNKHFYLIAGAFKGNRQANVLLEEMKKKGYTDAVIIDADKYSKKVKVAVEGFESEGDAYRASAKLKKVIGEEGWVYKKR